MYFQVVHQKLRKNMDFQGGQCKEMESSRVVTVNFTGNPGGSTSKKIDILDRRGTIYFWKNPFLSEDKF